MRSQIQNILLEMLKWFHKYCLANNITYYAVGGTMIGAARHKGFIPWDDDIDLAVPRKDYNRLIAIFTKQEGHYYLESPYSGNSDYLYSYAKLYDVNTTLTESTRYKCRRGVYIDVFPLDGLGDTREDVINNFKKFDRKNMFLMMRTCALRKERCWYKNLSIISARIIPNFIVNEKKLSISLDHIANSFNSNNSTYVANLMGTYRDREIMRREYFGNPTLYQFEDTRIFGPEMYDRYLTKLYGDWRRLPNKNKQKTSHNNVEIELNKSYLIW